jgi:hypothetical protein
MSAYWQAQFNAVAVCRTAWGLGTYFVCKSLHQFVLIFSWKRRIGTSQNLFFHWDQKGLQIALVIMGFPTGIRFLAGIDLFSSLKCPDLLCGPVSLLWTTGALAQGIRQHEYNHPTPCSFHIKNAWRYDFISTYIFLVWKYGESFTFRS